MCRKMVAAWMLAIAMLFVLGAGEVGAAEPVAAESAVVAEEAVVAPVAAVAAPAVAASEAAVEALAPAADVDPPWYLGVVETVLNYVWEFLASALFVWALKKAGDRKALADAIRSLEAGVNDAWYTVVKDLKSKAQDGKLTKEEKSNARLIAREKAKSLATGAGKKVLVALGEAGMNSLIEKIIRRVKAKAEAKVAA